MKKKNIIKEKKDFDRIFKLKNIRNQLEKYPECEKFYNVINEDIIQIESVIEKTTSWDEVYEAIHGINFIKWPVDKKVTLEIGRSIAASCGSYLTKVVDMKTNKYGNFVIMDGGINHLVYYGQTMGMKIPHYELLPHKDDVNETYNLCGSLCTINDFLVKNITCRKLKIDDIFVFKNVGAYSSTEGISLFLSRDLPKVILYEYSSYKVVREKFKTSNLNFPNNI